jgi:hypothetical protein
MEIKRIHSWVLTPPLLLICLATTFIDSHAQLDGLIKVIGGTQGDCFVLDNGPAVKTVSVRLQFNLGVNAVRFRIEPSPGATLSLITESHPIPNTLGDVTSGISICFDPCTGGTLTLVTVTYMTYGTSPSCSLVRVVPHPSAQTVDQIGCDGLPRPIDVQDLVIFRELGDCLCPNARTVPGGASVFDCAPVAVATSTWGAIKALYR